PQLPQLRRSVVVAVHTPLQGIWPGGQTHMLAEQVAPTAQTLPQTPQLLRSLLVLTQAPLQLVMPPPQTCAHIPVEQTLMPPVGVGGQPGPQAPQLLKLEAGSTHWPLHSAGRVPCVQEQAPFTHCWPPVQEKPHLPQLELLLVRLTQPPLQSVVPEG